MNFKTYNMKNLVDEILEIISYDDIDEDVKIKKIKDLCNKESVNQNNLITLYENVELDINGGSFDIEAEEVDTEFYKNLYKKNTAWLVILDFRTCKTICEEYDQETMGNIKQYVNDKCGHSDVQYMCSDGLEIQISELDKNNKEIITKHKQE